MNGSLLSISLEGKYMSESSFGGYNGKMVRVNLTEGTVKIETIDEAFCRKYIGGAGFVSYFLLKEVAPGIDPLGPENKLIFAVGPVTGIPLPGSGRHCVGAKSPLTGGIAKCEVGEFWGAELKSAGFDILIIEGTSPNPVYLHIRDGDVQVKDAAHLWGKNTKETMAAIQEASKTIRKGISISCICINEENADPDLMYKIARIGRGRMTVIENTEGMREAVVEERSVVGN